MKSDTKDAVDFLRYLRTVVPEDQEKKFPSVLRHVSQLVKAAGSWIPALGLLIHIRGKPFIDGMFQQFEPMFDKLQASHNLFKCGRQCGKSSSNAAKTIVMSAMIPYFQSLTVTPQFEMTRRFSTNYIRPLLEDSPVALMALDAKCEKSVLQKTLTNKSILHFSFAFLDCSRIRGLSIDKCLFDEIQDIEYEFIDEISHTMDRSAWRLSDYSGTPKTLDNAMQILWEKSSQAEWIVPCSCGYSNNPNVEADGLKMIGDHTLVCAKCLRPIDSNQGYWKHFYPDRYRDFKGWHVPQHVLPFHYSNPKNWDKIVTAKHGATSKKLFYNEILGESCDVGAKLITETDLRKACTLPVTMDLKKAQIISQDYAFTALGVDWGGRGEESLSFTKAAIIGIRPSGHLDLLYGENLAYLTDAGEEVYRVINLYKAFGCHVLAHDAGGTAGMRDVLLAHAGFNMSTVMPMCYVPAWAKEIVTYHDTTETIRRPYYEVDKTKSLLLAVLCIQNGIVSFPRWESCQDLLKDFLALIEEKTETRRGGDVYLVRRSASQCDDFAHALNFAMMATFHVKGQWPDLVGAVKYRSLTQEQMSDLNPEQPTLEDWNR